MKLPRDLSGRELARLLAKLEYQKVRQVGSHMRLSTERNGRHRVTVPDTGSLPVGTLKDILLCVAKHHHLAVDELLSLLFE